MNKIGSLNKYAADCANLKSCIPALKAFLYYSGQIQWNSQRIIWELAWDSGGLKPLLSNPSLGGCLGRIVFLITGKTDMIVFSCL